MGARRSADGTRFIWVAAGLAASKGKGVAWKSVRNGPERLRSGHPGGAPGLIATARGVEDVPVHREEDVLDRPVAVRHVQACLVGAAEPVVVGVPLEVAKGHVMSGPEVVVVEPGVEVLVVRPVPARG